MSRRGTFSVAREPVELELGGGLLTAPPIIPPAVLGELLDVMPRVTEIEQAQGVSQKDQLEQVMKIVDEVMGMVLLPESAAVFHERLYSRTDPYDLEREVMPGVMWLVEEYTKRPTEPSPPSTTGPSDGTSNSMSGPSVEESTSTPSQPTAGATPSTPPSTT